jgi:uncharacterized RDD family membrane protein YckC
VTRSTAFVVDAVVIAWTWTASRFVIRAVWALVFLEPEALQQRERRGVFPEVTSSLTSLEASSAFEVVLLVVIVLGYLTLGWWLFGRTVGYLVAGIRVVDRRGLQPRFTRSLLRAVMYPVSVAFVVGLVWVAFSPTRRSWPDWVARTWVLYDWDAHPHTDYDDNPLPPRTAATAPTA